MEETVKTVKTKKTVPKEKEVAKTDDLNSDKIKKLEKQLADLMTQLSQPNVEPSKIEKHNSDDEITIISQCLGELNLIFGDIKSPNNDHITLENFGDMEVISFAELKDIVKYNKSFVEKGYFYIVDELAVKQLRLERYYNRLLSVEDMSNLFNNDAKSTIELYKLANDGQKEIIIDLISNRILNKEKLDANVLVELGKLSGKDLMKMIEDYSE
ncbi:MAG: hypothetical protein RR255_00260 [Bacilli bacterium]